MGKWKIKRKIRKVLKKMSATKTAKMDNVQDVKKVELLYYPNKEERCSPAEMNYVGTILNFSTLNHLKGRFFLPLNSWYTLHNIKSDAGEQKNIPYPLDLI